MVVVRAAGWSRGVSVRAEVGSEGVESLRACWCGWGRDACVWAWGVSAWDRVVLGWAWGAGAGV